MKLDRSFLKVALPAAQIVNEDSIPAGHECTVSIDTRSLAPGQVFLALAGSKVDGHDFLFEALEKGAAALIIQESERERLQNFSCKTGCACNKIPTIIVPDTLAALVDLARAWRKRFDYPVVGITGSIGKTTTKEMVHAILEHANIPACVSYKNQNTLVGLSLNILKMRDDHKAAVFELGISNVGEMKPKVDILRPTIGVITRIAHSHMEGLGPLPEIAREKREIFSYFAPGNIGIIFGDQQLLDTICYSHPVIRFGLKTKNQVQARKIHDTNFVLKLYKQKKTVSLATGHKGNICNALAASTVAHLLNVPFDEIVAGLEAFAGFEERFEKRRLKGDRGWLINDCYNANPESMREALVTLHEMKTHGQKIAILGDMLELGEKELFWHRQVGRVLTKALSIKDLILVGERAKSIAQTAPIVTNVSYASDWKEASEKLEEKLKQSEALVLVKASLAMDLKQLVNQFVVSE